MTKQKATKRALLMSFLSILLCVSMLIGTTYAWFTDSVTSANNIIKSGNLDIELDYWNGTEWKDVEAASDILAGDLWEPGYVDVAYLRLQNAGSLALKYQLGVNIISEKTGVNKAGETFKLSDSIYFDVVEGVNGETAAYKNREDAMAKATETTKISAGFSKAGTLAAESDPVYLAMVVYMPTTVGNEANHDGKTIPQIDLGINVFATQQTAESDSFNNQYDVNAPFSVWDGTVPTEMPESLVVDGATNTIHVKDADAFAYLSTLSAKWADFYTDGNGRTYTNYANGKGTNYYYSGDWTVSLEADIDLNYHAIAPVEIVIGENCGYSAFNGNNHVIRNVNTTTGLFADMTRTNYANLVLENVNATKGALTGISGSSVTNVTVKNATIIGVDYIGGLVGRVFGNVSGCKVIESSVVATGKEAGGLIGYAEANSNGFNITNNTVKNVTVYANNRAAGLVAQPNVNIKVYNNFIDCVIVGAADTTKYQSGAVVSNALAPENVYDNTVTNAIIAKKAATATDNATFGSAISDGADTVFLGSGDYIIPNAAKGKTTLTIVGYGDDTSVAVTKVGNGGENCDYGLDGSTVVFANITITTNSSTYIGYARCNGTYYNCTFNGTYTLYGNSEFNNCTFNVSGDIYNIWTWGAPKATFNNCTFNNDGKAILLYGTANTKLTVNGCTFNDNGDDTVTGKAAIEIGNDYGKSYELIVNDTTVNGYAINDKGINTGSTLWANKNSMGTDKLNVVIDGVDVY